VQVPDDLLRFCCQQAPSSSPTEPSFSFEFSGDSSSSYAFASASFGFNFASRDSVNFYRAKMDAVERVEAVAFQKARKDQNLRKRATARTH
jgi:hypothetical protein